MSNTDDAATATEHLAQLSLSSSSPPIVHDEYGTEWLDITQLMQSTTAELARGELIRPQTLTLFDAMTSIEVMDPRLDMGMLTEQDEEEISKWDMERVLTMRETLWIIETMFQCEMTWQASASLLQTIYMCQYFSQDDMPETAGKEETKNPCRDLVLYPYLIALGRCCRLVWAEYMRENMYSEEDVYFGSYVSKFFDEFSLTDVIALMGKATAFLDGWLADSGANADEDERKAAQQIQDHLVLRDSWLSTLIHTSVDYLLEDPSALRKSGEELAELQSLHTSMQQASTTQSVAVEVPGVFDKKCMRNYPTMAPIKPKPLKTLAESHSFFSSMISELGLVQQLMDVDNVESLLHLALQFAQRTPTASPLVRSLVASLFVCENRILLRQPIIAFTERAIRECTGPYIWNVLEAGAGQLVWPSGKAIPKADDLIGARQRVGEFVQEAARMVIDWVKTQCQNAPRQRRIALKYLGGWDSLQGEAEQLDIWLFTVLNPQAQSGADDPKHNPFWFSSWAYHMKLLMMEISVMAGMRLDVYLEYEFSQVFCYATQVFEAHFAHLTRMEAMLASKQGQSAGLVQPKAPPALPALWTMRPVSDTECLAQISRWKLLVMAQKDLATAMWLVTHACERLGVFRAPWAQRRNILALTACKQQETPEAHLARYALRFRVFQRLNSPTPLTFDGWQNTTQQLDGYRICDLFAHAAQILAATKSSLDSGRKQVVKNGEHGRLLALWEKSYRSLYFVVLSNTLSLAKLAADPAMNSLAATTTGHDALAFRAQILDADIAALSPTPAGNETQPAVAAPKSKSKAKRDKQKKRKAAMAAKHESSALASAREWRASVDELMKPGKALDVACRCMADKHPDWPVFSFGPSN